MPKSKQRSLIQNPFPSLSLLPVSRSSTSRHSHARLLPSLPFASQPLLRHLSSTLYFSSLVSPIFPTPSKTTQDQIEQRHTVRVHRAALGTVHRVAPRTPGEQ